MASSFRAGARAAVRRRATGGLAAAAAVALALGGCGIAPGQAAVVGDTEISPEQVDGTAAVFCQLDESVAGVQSAARRSALEFLVGSQLVEVFGRSEGAIPSGAELSSAPALGQIQQDAQALPPEVRQDYVDTITRLVSSQLTLIAIGQRQAGEGSAEAPGTDPAADPDAALAAGGVAYSRWLERRAPEITVDPRYGTWEGSQLVASDSSLSVAVSEQAQQLAGGAGDLPATQRCS